MKKSLFAIVCAFGVVLGTYTPTLASQMNTNPPTEEAAAVTVRYYNKDSKDHVFKVKISGSTRIVEFGSSRTSSVTIQGGASECVIHCECGDVKVKGGDHITIKNGCITVD